MRPPVAAAQQAIYGSSPSGPPEAACCAARLNGYRQCRRPLNLPPKLNRLKPPSQDLSFVLQWYTTPEHHALDGQSALEHCV